MPPSFPNLGIEATLNIFINIVWDFIKPKIRILLILLKPEIVNRITLSNNWLPQNAMIQNLI